MKHLFAIVTVLMIFSACNPARRFQKFVEHNPEVIRTRDTILIDTAYLNAARIDFDIIPRRNQIIDTVIERDGLRLKILKTNQIFSINTYKLADTLISKRNFKYKNVVFEKADRWNNLINKIPWLVGALFMIMMLINKFIK